MMPFYEKTLIYTGALASVHRIQAILGAWLLTTKVLRFSSPANRLPRESPRWASK
jgi:hypothetical protein